MYEFTPADPTIKRPGHETRLTEKQKILLIYIPLAAFLSMMSGVVFGQNQAVGLVNLLFGVVINVLALVWVKIDADERRYALSRYFTLAVVLFSIFAITYYLFRSRGLTRGLISTGWLISYIVGLFFALMVVGSVITLLMVAAGLLPKSIIQ